MTTQSTNINAALIKNATNMQNQLLEFSHQLSNLSIKSLDGGTAYNVHAIDTTSSPIITVTYKKTDGSEGPSVTVTLGEGGTPGTTTSSPASGEDGAPTTAQQLVAKAIAVVAANLRGVGVGDTNIGSIFKDGITPTSLAAVESQLKGHHDAVLQLSLETLSRATQLMQQIARKLSS